jgi:hypothetical protein
VGLKPPPPNQKLHGNKRGEGGGRRGKKREEKEGKRVPQPTVPASVTARNHPNSTRMGTSWWLDQVKRQSRREISSSAMAEEIVGAWVLLGDFDTTHSPDEHECC